MHAPRRELEQKSQGKFSEQPGFEITYIAAGNVALECALIDLHTDTDVSINSPPLEVERKFQIVLSVEKARMQPKSSAKESYDLR
jgi:hypothetical protein